MYNNGFARRTNIKDKTGIGSCKEAIDAEIVPDKIIRCEMLCSH